VIQKNGRVAVIDSAKYLLGAIRRTFGTGRNAVKRFKTIKAKQIKINKI
jgi:hypothetical protein